MTDDLARLGFVVDTSGLTKGEKGLKKLSSTGEKTEKKVNSLGSTFKSFGTNASAAVASVDGPLGGISSRITALSTVATAGGAAMTLFAVGVTAFSAAVAKGVSELDDLQVSLAKTGALLSATDYASGFTGEQLASQAQEVARATLASVQGIQDAQGVLLTFKAVSGSVFTAALGLAQDMATVFGGDAKSSATQLGKALQDPILGVSALSRVGVTFTNQQKDQIKTLVESGKTLDAQRVILNELKEEFGGVGEAVASSTLAGSIDTIGQDFDNLTVRIASNIDALDTFKSIIDKIDAGIVRATEALTPDTATELFDKTLELQWQANAVEDEMEGLADGRRKRRLTLELEAINAQLSASQAATKETAALENDVITKRGDALRASLLAQKAAREQAAEEAAKEAKEKADKLAETEAMAQSKSISSLGDGLQDVINDITSQTTIGQIQELNNQIGLTKDLLEMGLIDGDIGAQYIKSLSDELDTLTDKTDFSEQFNKSTDAIGESLSAMRDLTTQGSSGYNKMSVAIAAVTAAQKVADIAAAATMATITGGISAAVSLISAISMLGGDIETTFESTQALQGLNEWGEKASAISDSTETTADATKDLVGINTDMLAALEGLQESLSGAAGISAKGIANTDFSYSADVFTGFTSNFFTDALNFMTFGFNGFLLDTIGSLFGGSSKVTDEGISILGGALSELMTDASVSAFRDVKSKKYVWSSSKTNTEYVELDDASAQFGLVFTSLADSVYEAGVTLGYAGSDLEDKINEFTIATTEISLKGLSTDEIAEEIENVFSEIFNDLASSVIPYLSDFQQTGEELGETLTRLASQSAIAEYAASTLGFAISDKLADPYLFATISDNLSSLLGGVENFGDYVSSFIDEFAEDSIKLTVYSDAVSNALTDVGLSLPATASGLWDLMESLDASTETGQEQIATILELTDTAGAYYDLLEDTQESMADLSDTFASAVMSIYDVSDAVSQVSIDAAIAAAKMGDFSLAENLNTSDYTLSTSDFASLAEYNVAQAVVANKLLELSQLSAQEAGDVETDQLDQLKAINQSIIDSITETNGLLRMQNKLQANSADYLDTINNKTEYAA